MSLSATPATQNQGGCRQAQRLPRETKVDAAKCHACHAKCRTGDQNGPKRATRASPVPLGRFMSPSARPATPATQNEGGCDQVPLLPRETKVDVAKCHACHAKLRWMPPSAAPAT